MVRVVPEMRVGRDREAGDGHDDAKFQKNPQLREQHKRAEYDGDVQAYLGKLEPVVPVARSGGGGAIRLGVGEDFFVLALVFGILGSELFLLRLDWYQAKPFDALTSLTII